MWYVMQNMQQSYILSDRLIRAISNWNTLGGEEDDVEALIDAGASVNNPHGTLLPLHTACMVGDDYCISLLIEKGAQVDMLDGYGRAALHYAAEKDVTCVEILLRNGADVNIQTSNQESALHWAAYKNKVRCVRMLLENGAKLNLRNFNDDTALSYAALKGSLESIKILLERNALVDTYNFDGVSPLMRAAFTQAAGLNNDKDDACLELLLKASGQFDFRNPDGSLPPMIERDNRLREMFLPLCNSVRSLQVLCRFTVRSQLGDCYLQNVIPKLPLPHRLQEYILLQR